MRSIHSLYIERTVTSPNPNLNLCKDFNQCMRFIHKTKKEQEEHSSISYLILTSKRKNNE